MVQCIIIHHPCPHPPRSANTGDTWIPRISIGKYYYYLIVKFYMFYKVFFIFIYFWGFGFLVFYCLVIYCLVFYYLVFYCLATFDLTVIGQNNLMNIHYQSEIFSSPHRITVYESVVIYKRFNPLTATFRI